ncbi:DegV family protein [Paenibacillus aquistagni]|uniref:EDD domain protein, DegV family n=1 Tax=Paenibacillus aquistagni TaxID=1852522 RepID=A0A1X7JLE5_9BACL|nr:DegV family protein [Paenibacillus aquistagni]SMG28638.1 EDD domain protein, DegV family [Paenibacillus aquistagni]
MTIQIITDGNSDLSTEIIHQLGISIVPLHIHFGSETYDSSMNTDLFYQKMRDSEELPKTSSPSPGDFYNIYKSLDPSKDILVLCVTSQLSSTYNHALMAKDMYEEEGYTNKIEVIDSRTASAGLGFLAVKAALLSKAGHSFHELQEKLKECVKQTRTYFSLDTLENVVKGGRMSRLKGTVASMLNIKILMQASDEGAIEVVEKVRGTQRVLKRMIDKVGDAWQYADRSLIALAHSNCEERAKQFMSNLMEKYPFENVLYLNMGPVIGTYAGEGGILIAFQDASKDYE